MSMHQLHQIGAMFGFPKIVAWNAKSPEINTLIANVTLLLLPGYSSAITTTGSSFGIK
jgi:hypothetical protein